jgi:MFS family permease
MRSLIEKLEKKLTFLQPWIVVFSAASFFFFQFINMNSFDALGPDLAKTFNINALTMSSLSSMYFYGNIFLIPTGLLLDRFSTKKLLLSGALLAALCTFLFAHAQTLSQAFILRFLIGALSTLCLLSCVKLTSRWFSAHLTGIVMGLVITFAMLGGIVAQQLSWINMDLGHDWRHTMSYLAGVGLLVSLLIACFVKDYPKTYQKQEDANQKALEKSFWKNFFLPFKNIQNWLAGLYANFLSIPIVVVGALFAETYLTQVYQISSAQAALVSSMIFFGVLIGCPVFGALSDRLKRRKLPLIIGAFLTLLISLFILELKSANLELLLTLFFLLGLFSGSQVLSYAIVVESNPAHLTATAESQAATLIMSAGAIFQPIFALVLEHHWDGKILAGNKIYPTLAYHDAMFLLPIALGLALILACFIRETYCKRI